ncbi:MAG: glycosyltransferase [Chitinophagales bacterium]|nr:glycosyltransferase [Chitinophagales bacterium]MCZ2393803.1 glycosyltransferase [Chitinophagales bacterium]
MKIEYLFYIAVGIQILFYNILFMRMLFLKPRVKVNNIQHLPISVVICAHNEEENLKSYLQQILEQEYPDFEVLVVNDGSTDGTLEVLNSLAKKYSHLKIISIQAEDKIGSGKKRALDLGIRSSKNPYLLLTDADCSPESKYWIKNMSNYFSEEHQIILGIAPYRHQGTFLHDIVRYETLITLIQYVSYALWKIPYMGVGRNIAYSKKLYNVVGGMSSHIEMISGDDDLFVQEAVKYTQVAICMEKSTYMYSQAPATWKQWWKQKTRHYTTGGMYSWPHQFLLGIFILTKISVYVLIIYYLFSNGVNYLLTLVFLVFLSMMSIIVYQISRKYSLELKSYQVLYLDLIFVISMILQGIHAKVIKRKDWK